MSVGGPQKDADNRDKVVSTTPLKYQTESEARAATDWWTKATAGPNPLKGHYA